MKKIIILGMSFLFLGVTNVSADSIENNKLTFEDAIKEVPIANKISFDTMLDEEKEEKEIEIAEKYEPGDVLSYEDALFLVNLENQKNEQNISSNLRLSGNKSISKTLTKYGTKVTLSGTMYQNIATGIGTSSYRGNISLKRNSGSLKKVALKTHHVAYGIIGWNGKFPSIGQVYKGSVSMSKTSSLDTTKMDKTTRYNGVLVNTTTMYTQGTITTSKGDVYTITSSNWKKSH